EQCGGAQVAEDLAGHGWLLHRSGRPRGRRTPSRWVTGVVGPVGQRGGRPCGVFRVCRVHPPAPGWLSPAGSLTHGHRKVGSTKPTLDGHESRIRDVLPDPGAPHRVGAHEPPPAAPFMIANRAVFPPWEG